MDFCYLCSVFRLLEMFQFDSDMLDPHPFYKKSSILEACLDYTIIWANVSISTEVPSRTILPGFPWKAKYKMPYPVLFLTRVKLCSNSSLVLQVKMVNFVLFLFDRSSNGRAAPLDREKQGQA